MIKLLRVFDVDVWLIQWVCINIGNIAWIDFKDETQCVLVFIGVISNPLMYLFSFFLFVLLWTSDRE